MFILGVFSLQAQNTEGKEFWLTYGKYANAPVGSGYVMIIRIVSGSQPSNGTIVFTNLPNGNPNKVVSFNIGAYQVFNHLFVDPQKESVYNTVTGTSNLSVHINASEPVTAFFFNHGFCAEATNLFPVTTLGTKYHQISYTHQDPIIQDAYAVVATQNNTQLWHNGAFVTTLNSGQVYYRASTDMTGALITSNNPVAFFAINQGAFIPHFTQGGSTYHKQIMQQLAPVHTWGKKFLVPVTLSDRERVRVVASQDGTDITQVGGTLQTTVQGAQTNLNNLQTGEFVELEITLANNGCYIEANYPVGICSFMTSFDNFSVATPAQCWIPGIEQTVSISLVSPFLTNLFVVPKPINHYALIVTPTPTKENTLVSVGGGPPVPVSGGFWKDNIDAGMSFYNMPLSNSSTPYIFTNQQKLFILGYGAGTLVQGANSYYYLAHSAMRELDAAFYANDIHFQDLKDNSMCEGDVHFLAEIEGLHPTHPDRITWWIDGTEYLPAKTLLSWDKPFSAGTYEIRMDVVYENNETVSKAGTLIIKSCNQSAAFFANNVLHSELKDTTFCNKNVNFRAEIEGLHPTASDSIMWYINDVFETSQATWNKPFENGIYEIKLVVHYDNDTYATLTGTLKIQALWIKIRNVRY